MDWLHVVSFGVAALGLAALLIGVFIFRRRLHRLAVLVVGGLLIAAGGLIATIPAPTYGPVIGSGASTEWITQPGDVGGRESALITAAAGEPFGLTISVENDGPLPIRILGLAVSGEFPQMFPAWESMSVSTNAMPPLDGAYDGASPASVEIPPGGILVLDAVGQATGCAAGSDTGDYAIGTDHVQIAYSVLGLVSAAELQLPNALVEPRQSNCMLF